MLERRPAMSTLLPELEGSSAWLVRKSTVELVREPIRELGPLERLLFLTSTMMSSYLSAPTDGSLLACLAWPLLVVAGLPGLARTGATGGGSISSRGGGGASSGGVTILSWPWLTVRPDIGTGSGSSSAIRRRISSSCSRSISSSCSRIISSSSLRCLSSLLRISSSSLLSISSSSLLCSSSSHLLCSSF